MNKPTLRSVALASLVAVCSMIALLVGLFTAGLIAGALSARNQASKPVEIIRYVQRPASAAAPSAASSLMTR